MKNRILLIALTGLSFVSAANAHATNLENMITTVTESCKSLSQDDPIAGVYSDKLSNNIHIGVMKIAKDQYAFLVLENDNFALEFETNTTGPTSASTKPDASIYIDLDKRLPFSIFTITDFASFTFERKAGKVIGLAFETETSIGATDTRVDQRIRTRLSGTRLMQVLGCKL